MGEKNSYTNLLFRHKDLIWQLCRRYAPRDADRCVELVQEVSLSLIEHYGRLKPDASAHEERAWVVWSTRTVLYDLRRKKDSQPVMVPLTNGMAEQIAEQENLERDRIEEMMGDLPDEDRRLVQLRLDGYNAKVIGTQTGLSSDAVYQRLHRIIEKLKQKYHAGYTD